MLKIMQFPERENPSRLLYLYSESHVEEEDVQVFWRQALQRYYLQHPHSLTFRLKDVLEAYTIGAIYPTSLVHSINKLKGERILMRKADLQPSSSNASSSTEEVSLVSAFISTIWTLGEKLLTANDDDNKLPSEEEEFVYLPPLQQLEQASPHFVQGKEEGDLVFTLKHIPDFAQNFTTCIQELCRHTKDYDLGDAMSKHASFLDNVQVVAQYFVQHQRAVLHEDVLQLISPTIKKVTTNEEKSTTVSKSFYASLLEVKISIHQLDKKISELENKSKDYKQRAIKAKAAGNTTLALSNLKLMKNVDEMVKRLYGAQTSLAQSLTDMEGSMVNSVIINAYKSASQGLKASREDGKLSIDSVEDAVDNFYEEMDEYKEINDALFASSALSTVEEDELSAELDALMKDPPVTVTAAKAAPIVTTTTLDTTAKPSPPLSLPNVPATIPIQTQETVKVNQKDDNIMQMEARLASL